MHLAANHKIPLLDESGVIELEDKSCIAHMKIHTWKLLRCSWQEIYQYVFVLVYIQLGTILHGKLSNFLNSYSFDDAISFFFFFEGIWRYIP